MNANNEPETTYFELQAYWGVTKHLGGFRATEALIQRCELEPGASVLEVGCGVGRTSCYLARRHEYRVTGVDLSERIVAAARQRAQRQGLNDLVAFRVADAQSLPFDGAQFDGVIAESVTAFAPDHAAALGEYTRVVRPGGTVGLNEGTWVQPSPPPALVDYVRYTMSDVAFLAPEAWEGLLLGAGLRDVTAEVHGLTMWGQWGDEVRGWSRHDWLELLGAWGKVLGLSVRSASFRQYVRDLRPPRGVMKEFFRYLGYGLYVGRK